MTTASAYPLANDENCVPLDVPASAAGWLVRRHGGGKGRPGSLYDADGRPLVVHLQATIEDLRALGCGPGAYRLDAVDDGRKPLGVTAYTELREDLDGDTTCGVREKDPTEALLSSMTRAFEGMFRVQAERERGYAERERAQTERERMLCETLVKLASGARLAAPATPSERLRNAIADQRDLNELLREALEAEHERQRHAVAGERRKHRRRENAEEAEPAAPPWFGPAVAIAAPFVGVAAVKLGERVGMSSEQVAAALNLGTQVSEKFQSVAAAAAATVVEEDELPEAEDDDSSDRDEEDALDDDDQEADGSNDGDADDDDDDASAPTDGVQLDEAVDAVADVAGLSDAATKARLRAVLRLLTATERAHALEKLSELPRSILVAQVQQLGQITPTVAVQFLRAALTAYG